MWLFSTRVLEDIMLNILKILLGGFFLLLLIFGWLFGIAWAAFEEQTKLASMAFFIGLLVLFYVVREEFPSQFKAAMFLFLAVLFLIYMFITTRTPPVFYGQALY